MTRTKTTKIHVRDEYHFLKRFGRGRQFYPLLLGISDTYRRFFPITPPYTVAVSHDYCGISEIAFSRCGYSLKFTYPRYQNVSYIFDSITEEEFSTTDGVYNLLHKKFFHKTGFFVYTSYPRSAIEPEKVEFPYKPAFELFDIIFKHPYTKKNAYKYVETCMEVYREYSEIFKEGKAFDFTELIDIVLKKFDITIDEIEKMEIMGILKFENGKIYKASSYNGKYLCMFSSKTDTFGCPMTRFTFTSPECYFDRIISYENDTNAFIVRSEALEQADKDNLKADAEAHLDDFKKAIENYEKKCSTQGSKPSGS